MKVLFTELLYTEAKGNYTQLVLTTATLLPALSFTAVEALLPSPLFIRTHRSFIVNRTRIDALEGNRIIGSTQIPIGQQYRKYSY